MVGVTSYAIMQIDDLNNSIHTFLLQVFEKTHIFFTKRVDHLSGKRGAEKHIYQQQQPLIMPINQLNNVHTVLAQPDVLNK